MNKGTDPRSMGIPQEQKFQLAKISVIPRGKVVGFKPV
jgi:hypothetical protein